MYINMSDAVPANSQAKPFQYEGPKAKPGEWDQPHDRRSKPYQAAPATPTAPSPAEPPKVEAFPPPIPLRTQPAVPEFPIDVLSPWMSEYVKALAIELQVPVDLPAMLSLGAVAAGLARKVSVTPSPGWCEPVNLFIMCALPPGERKSQTFRKVLAPVKEWEKLLQQEAASQIGAQESAKRVAELRVKQLEGQLAKAKPDDVPELQYQLNEAINQDKQIIVPPQPILCVDDDTPEMLAKELTLQSGRLLAASPEAKTLENIFRDQRANFDVFLKGHAGDDLRTGRITRGREGVDSPALTCLYSPQPAVLQKLAETSELSGRGFMARWFFSLPTSRVGYRDCSTTQPEVPKPIAERYKQMVTKIWAMPAPAVDEITAIEFTEEAQEMFNILRGEIEKQLRQDGSLEPLAGWGNKAAGLAARIAGILACTDVIGEGHTAVSGIINDDIMKRAIRLVKDYAIPHALAAFDLMGTKSENVEARIVLNWLNKRPEPTGVFTVRDLYRGLQSRFSSVKQLDPVLELLGRHELIRPLTGTHPEGPGRKPSPVYAVNPKAFTVL